MLRTIEPGVRAWKRACLPRSTRLSTHPQVAQLMLSQNETRIRPATRPEHQNFVQPEEFMRLWGVEVCGDGCRRL